VSLPPAPPLPPEEPGPLTGVRVLDLSRVVSGPLCSRLLADLGAEVIKVEPPDGDVSRTVPPVVGGTGAYFTQMNAGKRNVCLDLKAPGAADVVARLAEASDVLLENFRPGVLARLGIDPAALRTRNPRLIVCSISGWGQDGPWRNRRAYAPLMHAEVGFIEFAAGARSRSPASTATSTPRCSPPTRSSPPCSVGPRRGRGSTSTCPWRRRSSTWTSGRR
jgi:crotonobetainyl-CoA:carnitine CoA-transferase CaiB-like acyl-CoA transferase